jgi:putative ABC transport system ATP-binding protein
MIRLEGIWKTYFMGDQRLDALHEITEEIEAGENIALMGPSGSGKSTLLNIIGCLDQPSQGEYFLDGRPVAELDPDELAHIRLENIGFIFQSFHLIPRMTALANVALPMIFAGIPPGERDRRAELSLESVGLAGWAHHRPAELSGGQKQRVAIARAIVMQPRLLLADEPTGNLDTESGSQVLELLGNLNRQGITLLTVTHDPNVARLADRVLVLRDGQIVRRVLGSEVSNLAELFAPLDEAAASQEDVHEEEASA